jgi:hypothetical protein
MLKVEFKSLLPDPSQAEGLSVFGESRMISATFSDEVEPGSRHCIRTERSEPIDEGKEFSAEPLSEQVGMVLVRSIGMGANWFGRITPIAKLNGFVLFIYGTTLRRINRPL